MEETIKNAFYDPDTGYTGANKLYRRLQKKYPSLKLSDVQKVLNKQKVVQVNKKSSHNGSFVPPYPMFQFQIDLIHLKDRKLNKASYGLTCIDTFTKKADIVLLKRKTDQETADEGKEFDNNKFRKLTDRLGIELILTLRHAPVVERFNRTIKEMMHKYLQATESKTIRKVLPRIVKNYNNSYHKSIGMAPNDVTIENSGEVWDRLNSLAVKRNRPKIKAGDRVRVMIKEKAFEKKYNPRFSKAVYTVTARKGRYYYVDGAAKKKYLRAYLQKVDKVEDPKIEPDYEGSQEAHLKQVVDNLKICIFRIRLLVI